MLKADHIVPHPKNVDDTLVLPFELRQKSRLLTTLSSGREILVQLDRGTVLRHGTCLGTTQGWVVQVRAALEQLSVITDRSPVELARAAYHLGNRHVPIQIDRTGLRYPHDHVLDDMLRGLGLGPTLVEAPFEPERGAYGHGSHHSRHAH